MLAGIYALAAAVAMLHGGTHERLLAVVLLGFVLVRSVARRRTMAPRRARGV